MNMLLHICCGPCAIFPIDLLRSDGLEVTGFFFRHNIHPYTECLRRQETLRAYAARIDLRVIHQAGYDLEGFIRAMVFREDQRCIVCYQQRLQTTARLAREEGFDSFSTTLLYSRYQKHDTIREVGEAIGRTMGIPFYYRDFRTGWMQGVAESRRLGLYRQQYCGCIYSEKERYFKNKNEESSTLKGER